jgi:hypothetical protein
MYVKGVSRFAQAAQTPFTKPQRGNTRSNAAATSYYFFIMKQMSRRKKEQGPRMMYSGNLGLFDASLILSSLNIYFFYRLPFYVFVVFIPLHETADIPCRLK